MWENFPGVRQRSMRGCRLSFSKSRTCESGGGSSAGCAAALLIGLTGGVHGARVLLAPQSGRQDRFSSLALINHGW